ncbi:MAG: hypothetical protein E3J47_05175 [Candidatus Stahlbacteria bacterium]|nr:MAG: hypothetical protein E3J47_05175 [Candidatus Stahlbacteria bacterium]
MNKNLAYTDLSDEDKLLMDGLFQYKAEKEVERKILRNILAQLRKREMNCTKEIMDLSQRKIGEKFELGKNSAKPLNRRTRENIKDRLSEKEIKKPKSGVQGLKYEQQQKILSNVNEAKICSKNGHQSIFYC